MARRLAVRFGMLALHGREAVAMSENEKRETHPAVFILALALVGVALALLAMFLLFPIQFRENRLYLTQDRTSLDFRFDTLSQDWTEADLRRRFEGKPIICYSNQQTGGLGDKVCNVDIGSHNGTRAMGAAFFFAEGKLANARVTVPWWVHDGMLQTTLRLYGSPSAAQPRRVEGNRLLGWKLATGGGLFYNIDRSTNPLQWSALYWQSERACASRCFQES